jgi:ABC-type bacteriocin/lantibiotic exporter with double-glycine peptidase domain
VTVRQRGDADCGVAALSIIAEVSYEDAYVAVAHIDKRHRGKNGLHNREVVAAAKRLGLRLRPTRAYDLDDDEGVLRIRWNDPSRSHGGHFVAVRAATISCPSDGMPLPWQDYLDRWNARAATLLRIA